MSPRSPLPRRDGLDASWVRTPDNLPGSPRPATMLEFLQGRLPADADVTARLAAGEFADAAGRPLAPDAPYAPHSLVWFHRPRLPEPVPPGELVVLDADERTVVVDKPHFLATTPRGAHVAQSVVARLRARPEFADVVPAHRLDRLTAGVLLLTRDRRHRAAYADLFASRAAAKVYEAVAPLRSSLRFPLRAAGRIEKRRGVLQAELVPGEPNALTDIDLVATRDGYGLYRLRPHTGRTHQLRLQLCSLGVPIVGDPLYPRVLDVGPDDFSTTLRLVARELSFADPVDGRERSYASGVRLTWPDGTPVR